MSRCEVSMSLSTGKRTYRYLSTQAQGIGKGSDGGACRWRMEWRAEARAGSGGQLQLAGTGPWMYAYRVTCPRGPPSLPRYPFLSPSQSSLSLSFLSPQSYLSQCAFASPSNQWPWPPWPGTSTSGNDNSFLSGVGHDAKHGLAVSGIGSWTESPSIHEIGHELGHQFGQAGARFGACVGELVGHVMHHFPGRHVSRSETLVARSPRASSPPFCPDTVSLPHVGGKEPEARFVSENGVRSSSRKEQSGPPNQVRSQDGLSTPHGSEFRDLSNEEAISTLSKSHNQFQKQSSFSVSTTFDSRTQDIETAVVARGDLWRVEASQGGTSSPLFLLQVGPVLFVRASTLLIPVHLSKHHCLWYGFDRKDGLHSLCPAVWSKHRRWLAMSMVCLNPLTCSFMDLQFPNGQLTFVAGEGLTGSAFMPAFGGLLQAQGRMPGDTKLSYSCKNKWGTRISPALQLPDQSISIEFVQPLAWQRSGLIVRPTVELHVTPLFEGRNSGWRAEVIHSPLEKLSWGCAALEQWTQGPLLQSHLVGRSEMESTQEAQAWWCKLKLH